ncbi:MAG TPA: CoA transferase [Steroidobacteraceae bacterium]|nr:CoA transferase [Steroidobacteraceae bacterium]
MTTLAGHRVVAWGHMAVRPLARLLASLGAEVVAVQPGAKDALAALRDASFFVDDVGLALLADAGVSRAELERINPGLIHVSVSPFGSTGPRARWRGGELVASAMGGVLRLTGEPDRPPVKEAFDACTFHADMAAAAGAMAAHYSRGSTGRGQHVDVSIQEVAFGRCVNSILVWQFERRKLHRVGGALNYGRATVRCIWPLADGWCFHSLMTGRFGATANQALSDWIDEAGLPNPLRGVDWLTYNRSTLDPALRAEWEAAIDRFFRTRTVAEIRGEGRRRGTNACAIATPADVLADVHLAARDFWEERAGLRAPRRFALIREGVAGAPVAAGRARRPGPLAGVRVLDFSWALVGSITTKILGDLGADVIKVESRTRPCLSRIDVQVAASKAGDFDDKPWFAHLNSSKRSLALDMKRPESREVLEPLIEWADVIVENFSPGTMAKLGLDYEALAKRNPGIVMVSGSVYGQSGPLAQEWGVDGTGAALSGRTYLTGWPDRDPVIPGCVPYGDVIVPYVMAACAAAALQRRRETGHGAHVDASMYEICVQQMWPAIRDAQLGSPPQRTGNADAGSYRQDVFPAAGEDRWIAISVSTAAQWSRLCELAGGEDIAAWTRSLPEREAVETLQAEGIAAGVLQDIQDLMEDDPGLAKRGALMDIEHARLGRFGHVRTPISFSRDRIEAFRAPNLGEHSREIAGLAGMDAGRFESLESLGVFR